ncbi:MAG TPA: hypothetical protein VHG51_03400 [Longimicrobiaceae bacterium]|nr:hypothetical protein [Longimicrobiaceae bacterium]
MGEVFIVMMVPITAILTTGTVMIVRPLTTRLGGLLEAMTQERRQRSLPAQGADMAQLRDVLSGIDRRLALLEERQDFAEALLSTGERRALAPQAVRTEHN